MIKEYECLQHNWNDCIKYIETTKYDTRVIEELEYSKNLIEKSSIIIAWLIMSFITFKIIKKVLVKSYNAIWNLKR